MPFFVVGGLAAARASGREGYALLRGLTVVGGPFQTRAAAEAHVHGYISAARRQAEAVLGITLPPEPYAIVAGRDLVQALCAALGLPDPGER
jgi:hypothetical protein